MYFAGDDVDATTPLKLKWAFANSKTHLLAGTGNCRSANTARQLALPFTLPVPWWYIRKQARWVIARPLQCSCTDMWLCWTVS